MAAKERAEALNGPVIIVRHPLEYALRSSGVSGVSRNADE
jgi:hypothetical protein